ncbi:helix-turn-helix domain-containing protein [Streptomyces anulatus]|nr:helix-turn-helix domain-containing protein [Streptomyces anulatus]
MRRIPRGRNLTGAKAKRFTKDVIDAYETMSIRAICQQTGRSYGAIHRLLKINKVTMRPRGYQHGMPASSADSS